MKWRVLGKSLSILSALLLAGCFVAYKQEQSKQPGNQKSGEMPLMPGSKNPNRMTVFPSSKNIDAVLSNPSRSPDHTGSSRLPDFQNHSDFVPPGSDEEPAQRKLLPSSKIGAILSPEDIPLRKAAPEDEGAKGKP